MFRPALKDGVNKMDNLITIPDSDEETNISLEFQVSTKSGATDYPQDKQTERKSINRRSSISLSTNLCSSPTPYPTSPPKTPETLFAKHCRRSRKSKLETLRISPTDIQFETIIALDDDDSKELHGRINQAGPYIPLVEIVEVGIRKMLNTEDMQLSISSIAEERVRCNFLLATYHLPDMNFVLNTHIDILKYEFRDRLRQRRERFAASTCEVTKPIN
ncbi:uncharacterized protein LOC115628182 [Scaptodrosophila lebanonensis]|uniref:Uncharacterized protein LOC115628182 n=1 Tax=Drosophila lebanonensis TaxID=7225 RepID=A0A6J2TTX9_DROLE|nr:uncharacterized protein LOC115628182 [Scaptodrosophila lebanonensis]